ncbi:MULTISPECIES: PcfJ domain-containing protein [unclassified Bradyrhizobium]|uniref:PcfJ domain-containing protein n=1 Tax=unclassified Bradyrhizobium TaxID=2631580 RepID=UPI0028E66436|nr:MULTISPECIES: PcfJ domain-containing protein [unclassified Bradyrhizobium]
MTSHLLLAPRREPVRSSLPERRLRRYCPRYQSRVRACAMRHPHLADLAVSFPALLFALAEPRRQRDPELAIACVIAGRPLAVAAAAAGIPMWLRKLPPEAFVRPIDPLPDGELFRRQIGNHLPRSPKLMPRWLQLVAEMVALAHEPAAAWIARELVRVPKAVKREHVHLLALWIWFSGQPGCFARGLIERPWTPHMKLDAALAAASDWRRQVTLHLNLGQRPVSNMWLDPGRIGDYEFRPLADIRDLVEEGIAMRNCVRTYGSRIAHNRSRLWSVRSHGERVATLEIADRFEDGLLHVAELKGPGNAPAPRELWWAARRWLHLHDLPQVETGRIKWCLAPLDLATWRALWRPYWLAKRRIPDWLPLAPSRDALGDL